MGRGEGSSPSGVQLQQERINNAVIGLDVSSKV